MEDSLIEIIIALMVLGLLVSFSIGVLWGRRAGLQRSKRLADPKEPSATGERGVHPSDTAPVAYNDEIDIPAALVGARYKALIEHIAPLVGTTPANLLRAALTAGLTGGRLFTEEMLNALKVEAYAMHGAPPSKRGPSRSN